MQKKDALALDIPQLLQALHTSDKGLSAQEAAIRLQQAPAVHKKSTVSAITILRRQFQSALIYLLIAASAISFAIRDYSDALVILAILAINTSLGFFQEYKSERILQKLELFISKMVRVKRDGVIRLVNESMIVQGDIVILHEGDITPADMRVLEADNIEINESALTGESALVNKKAGDAVYTGSVIEKGEVTGVVYAIGTETEFGEVVKLSTETKKETEYERSLKSFSTFLLKVVLVALTFIFFAKFFLNRGTVGVTSLLLFVISMAIVVVPEVLPVIATVSLSSGALRLAKKHVVVKRLSSVEDLGNISVLCTDKTGTITENKMAVQSIEATNSELFQLFAAATISILKNRKRRVVDAYDDAFINYIPKELKDKAATFTIVKEVPFDPTDKRRRVVVHDSASNEYYLLSIGAPEALLAIAASDKKDEYLKTISDEGSTGLHHVAIAYKSIPACSADYDILKDEHDLIFLGYASLTDPLRSGAKETIDHAKQLGIHIKILTGDSKEVATYIGRQVGLVTDTSKVYSGDELALLSEEEFKKAVTEHHVYARVTPAQKFAIIKALKESYVVGYQGDGINDAPALKLADVAIAVNSATDIAKENADIVLLNKDLEVIINGIRYGRTIFVNINKYIKYTMVSNFGGFMALAVLYLFSHDLPLLPIQVLLINVLTDIPLITIYSDTVEDSDIVKPERHNIKELLFISLMLGVPTALFELLYYLMIRSHSLVNIQTSLYVFFTFTALIIFYAFRSNSYFWKSKIPSLLLNGSFLVTFLVSFSIIYITIFQRWFHFVPLSLLALGIILGTTVIYFLILDTIKVWYYRSAVAKSAI